MTHTFSKRRHHTVPSDIEQAIIAAWHGQETAVEIAARLGMSARTVRSVFTRLAKQGRVPAGARDHVTLIHHPSQQAEVIDVGKDTLLARLTAVHGEGGRP